MLQIDVRPYGGSWPDIYVMTGFAPFLALFSDVSWEYILNILILPYIHLLVKSQDEVF